MIKVFTITYNFTHLIRGVTIDLIGSKSDNAFQSTPLISGVTSGVFPASNI